MASGREMQRDSQLDIDGILMSLLSEIEKNDPRQDFGLSTPEVQHEELQQHMVPSYPENQLDAWHQNLLFFSPEVIQESSHQEFMNPFIVNRICTAPENVVSPNSKIRLSVLQQNPVLSHNPHYQQAPPQQGCIPIPKNDVALHQLLVPPNPQNRQACSREQLVSLTPDNQQGTLEQCVLLANPDNQPLFLEQCMPPPNPGIKHGLVQEYIMNFNPEILENAVQDIISIPSTTQNQQVLFSPTPEIPIVEGFPHPDSSVTSPNPPPPTPEPSLPAPQSHPIPSTDPVEHKARESTYSEMPGLVQSDKKYQCQLCTYGTDEKCNYNRHQRIHTGERPHQCAICDGTFTRKAHVKIHMNKYHSEIKKFPSPFFKTKTAQNKHTHTYTEEQSSANKARSAADTPEMPGLVQSDKKYRCQRCAYATKYKYHYTRHHQLIHTGVKTYQCEFCDRRFTRSGNLKAHIKRMHSDGVKLPCPNVLKKCPHCVYATNDERNYTRHQRRHTDERPYLCEFCGKTFCTTGKLNTHIENVHRKAKLFVCANCKFVTTKKAALISHVRSHFIDNLRDIKTKPGSEGFVGSELPQSDKKYQCRHCAYGTDRWGVFNKHQRTHSYTGERTHQCQFCNKRFTKECRLGFHIKKMHTEIEKCCCSHDQHIPSEQRCAHIRRTCTHAEEQASVSKTSRSSAETREMSGSVQADKKFHCHLSVFATNFIYDLDRHQLIHSGAKPHSCELCDRTFSRADTLKIHMNRIHKSESCPNKRDTKIDNLPADIHAHANKERRHVCGECGFATSRSHDLRRHLATHTGERKHSCPHCGYTCITSWDMKRHIRTNHADGKIASNICTECGAAFVSKSGLLYHNAKSHLK